MDSSLPRCPELSAGLVHMTVVVIIAFGYCSRRDEEVGGLRCAEEIYFSAIASNTSTSTADAPGVPSFRTRSLASFHASVVLTWYQFLTT